MIGRGRRRPATGCQVDNCTGDCAVTCGFGVGSPNNGSVTCD
ncbi:MAG: hypothetical protein ABMA64_12415 [Myxococcota bacterium]